MDPINPSIWDYTDFRRFLRDSFATSRAMGNPVSNRWLAKRLGFKSFSFITMLLQGKRNLTRPNRDKFARLLGLDREEADYFAALVEYNQSRDAMDRQRSLRSLSVLQRPGGTRRIYSRTLEVSPEGFARIASLFEDFRAQVEAVLDRDSGAGQTYQIGVQVFPLPKLETGPEPGPGFPPDRESPDKPEALEPGAEPGSRLPGIQAGGLAGA